MTDFHIARKKTRSVDVGGVVIGDGAPISVQSMLSVPLGDEERAIEQAHALLVAGCDIIRVAIPDADALDAFKRFRRAISAPIVADIHFDYRLAIGAAKAGADKLRINPGNIGSPERVRAVADAAKAAGIPIRIGVNAGSLPKSIANNTSPSPDILVDVARREIALLESHGFHDIVVSIKSHDPALTVLANRLFSNEFDIPLHIGVTEAGLPADASIKSAVGIGALVLEGIGDTVRVSITGDPVEEVLIAKAILRSCGAMSAGIEIVSCPTCGRTRVDVAKIAQEVADRLPKSEKHIVVAVMGCEVNGPGEARAADVGIAGGKGDFVTFKKGEVCGKISANEAVDWVLRAVQEILHK